MLRTIVCLLLIGSRAVVAADPQPAKSETEIKALVDQLVSPNPKPITGDDDKSVAPNYRLLKGFDRAKQRVVAEARFELGKIGTAAFSHLIEKWDDDRHCMTMFHRLSEYSSNYTVGAVCQKTLFDQLQPYSIWPQTDGDPRGKPKRPAYPTSHLKSKKEALKWWEGHKDKSLYQIQLEVLDWVIAEEAKKPKDYSDEERDFLAGVRAELVRRGEPMSNGNYDWNEPEL